LAFDLIHFTQKNFNVLRSAKDEPQWSRDLARRQNSGRYLVQQWLKSVVVFSIDQDDVDIFVREGFGRAESAKPSADNHDPLSRSHYFYLRSN
jgi:hypothetical protein